LEYYKFYRFIEIFCSGYNISLGYILTYKGLGNKTRTVYVPKKKVKLVKERIGKWREACQLLDELCNLNVELFKNE